MKRPQISVNLATSLDGRLAGFVPPADDRRHMDMLRCTADAILIGASTLRAADYPLQLRCPVAQQRRAARGLAAGLGCVVLSRSLDLPWGAKFFAQPQAPFVAVASGAGPVPAPAPPAGAQIWACGDGAAFWPALWRHLAERGVGHLLVEGGGEVVGQLLALGAVDRLHLSVCPHLVGQGPALRGSAALRLVDCVRRDEVLFCTYEPRRG